MIESASGVAELGTILGIWAHPDDEAYLSGGLMALACDNGSRVVCVTATRGELGTPDPVAWPPRRLAAERAGELARCLEILGVTEHHWLGYRDGECAAVPASDAVAQLCAVTERIGPDTVLTFGPDGITGHPDHQTVSAWTTAAFDRVAPSGARPLHATVAERRVPRWNALDDSLGVYLPGYAGEVVDHVAVAVQRLVDPTSVGTHREQPDGRYADEKRRARGAGEVDGADVMLLGQLAAAGGALDLPGDVGAPREHRGRYSTGQSPVVQRPRLVEITSVGRRKSCDPEVFAGPGRGCRPARASAACTFLCVPNGLS